MHKIKIIDVSNLSKIENYIDTNMIDIAYVDSIDGNVVTLLLENEIHLNNPDDEKWIFDLINQALSECQEYDAKIIFPKGNE